MRPFRQTISSHGLNHWPVLSEKCRRIVDIGRLHLDAASLSSAVVRYLKMERVSLLSPHLHCSVGVRGALVPPFVRRTRTL
jgi:hypothetical protein